MRIGKPVNKSKEGVVFSKDIALCVIGRRENRYAREYVEYYKMLGFDKIFLCDNNRSGEEHFEDVLQDHIDSGFVQVIDVRDKDCVQCATYAAVYRKYGSQYRWMAFFDFDEYLTIADGCDIHALMERYEGYECVFINWMCYGDCGLLHDDGRPLTERFYLPLPMDLVVQHQGKTENSQVKCVLHGGLENVCFFNTPHLPSSPHLNCCNSAGESCQQKAFQKFEYTGVYLRHFITKTVEEWATNKWQKGTGNKESIEAFRSKYAGRFFAYNEWTKEKDDIMRKYTGMPPFKASKKRDVVIVNYNTQRLTDCTIRSLNKVTPGCHIYVFDNSDTQPFYNSYDNVKVLDNTHGQIIDLEKMIAEHSDRVPTPENRYGSAKHCRSIDVCMDLFPDGFLLMDSDILVKKDVTLFFDDSCAWTGMLQMHTSRFGVTLPRVLPFICYINVPMLRQHGIRYYDDVKMFALTDHKPEVGYDTGCFFYEECKKHNLPENHVDINNYILHLKHGSWMSPADEEQWIENNKQYWE